MFDDLLDMFHQVLTSLTCQIAHRASKEKIVLLAVWTTALLSVVHATWQLQLIVIL